MTPVSMVPLPRIFGLARVGMGLVLASLLIILAVRAKNHNRHGHWLTCLVL